MAVRPFAALGVVLLLFVSSLLGALAPAGAVLVEGPAQGTLPLEWALGPGESATFDLELPADGRVTAAELSFEGAPTEVPVELVDGVDRWATLDYPDISGFETSFGTLELVQEHKGTWFDGEGLAKYEDVTDLEVGKTVRLAMTSPRFSASGGGTWDYYKEVELVQGSGEWMRNTLMWLPLDIPAGHCKELDELRVMDPRGHEVPLQVVDFEVSPDDSTYVYVQMLFPVDLPPGEAMPYRVYYGNHLAEPPGYDPYLLGVEMWDYNSMLSPEFTSAWRQLPWNGGNGAGSASARLVTTPDGGRVFQQTTEAVNGRTFSQVWTSSHLKYGDFQLHTWLDDITLSGTYNSQGMWGIDFRTAGTDCYRLVYSYAMRMTSQARLTLFMVKENRHLTTSMTPSNQWATLAERTFNNSLETHVEVLIRAKGDSIQVFVDDLTKPIIDVRDTSLDTGQIGTFQAANAPAVMNESALVTGSYGPMLFWSPSVNLTEYNPSYLVSEERRQHTLSGTYVSMPIMLEGARDAVLSLDLNLPWSTFYTASLLSASGEVLLPDVRDGAQVPEKLLDGELKLHLVLSTDRDHITPELRGWGIGYRFDVNVGSDRTPEDVEGVIPGPGSVRLAPSRDIWMKDEMPVLKPNNMNEDRLATRPESMVQCGDEARLFYTGYSASGLPSICVAHTMDGMEFYDFRVVFSSSTTDLGWSALKSNPFVIRTGHTYLMYFIGRNQFGQVGLAVSGNGYHWTVLNDPVLGPSSSGFDGYSIEDCAVYFDERTSRFQMYYTGKASSSSSRLSIGHAVSGDGVNWVKSVSNPVITPGGTGSDWDTSYVREPYPVQTRDKVVLYYLGGKGTDPYSDLSAVGVAVSDDGLDFVKAIKNPVMEPRKGGLADDYRGIRDFLVIEEPSDRHSMLFSGQGMDFGERAFWAHSGYVKQGSYVTKPFVLDRPPRSLGPLNLEMDVPPATTVTVYVLTSDGKEVIQDWTEVPLGEVLDDFPTGTHVQLRFNFTSEFGDATPMLYHAYLKYLSNIRSAGLTVFPAITLPHPVHHLEVAMEGAGAETVDTTVAFVEPMGWTDVALYTGHARYGEGPEFGYRMNVTRAQPGDHFSIESVAFNLTYVSWPTGVSIDVGDDGSQDGGIEDMEVATGDELVLDVTDAVAAALASAIAGGIPTGQETVNITVRVTAATPGIVALAAVMVELDTPPVLESRSPDRYEVWMDEGTTQSFAIDVSERDGQDLEYEWTMDTVVLEDVTGSTYEFLAEEGQDWSQPFNLLVSVTDGNFTTGNEWLVHVNETVPPVNQPPQVDSTDPSGATVTIDENDTINLTLYATDPDSGPLALTYRWFIDDEEQAGQHSSSLVIATNYEWAGEYTVRVEAFDGKAGVNHTWDLVVRNVQPPQPPNGNGGEEGGDDFNMLPLLLILVILVVAGAGGALYMRSKRMPSTGPGADLAVEEPVTAEVPIEEELPAFEESMAREVAAGPGSGETGLGPAEATGAAGAAAPIVAIPLADLEKDRTYVIEEVYVVYNDGRLMCHRARAERTSVDTDLFGGMFTAIQQFIQDSMGGAEGGSQVGRLDYGENRILVERGNHIFLAAIIFGEEQESLREALRDVINRIEGAYAGVIERWSGDQTQLAGVADFITPLIGLTQDLTRETIMSKTRTEGIKMLSEVEFFQGFVRLKVAVRNDTKTVVTNVATDIVYDGNVLRVDRIQPEYPMSGTKVTLGTIGPREKKTVAYYLDPLICQESDIDGTTTYKDHEGAFHTVTMKRRRADIVCPIFFTEENANTAMLKRLIKEELRESDSKLFTIPKMLPAPDAFELAKEVIRGHDVRFVREFTEAGEEDAPFHGEAWFYGVTKVKKDKMVIRTSVWEERNTVEFFVASGRMESITGLLAELGQNLNRVLKEKYLGRMSATLVVDPDKQDEVRGLGLLIDKYSEGEMEAGEVDQ